jgi:hypothetical protein
MAVRLAPRLCRRRTLVRREMIAQQAALKDGLYIFLSSALFASRTVLQDWPCRKGGCSPWRAQRPDGREGGSLCKNGSPAGWQRIDLLMGAMFNTQQHALDQATCSKNWAQFTGSAGLILTVEET